MLDIVHLILIVTIIILLVIFYVTNKIKLAKLQSVTVTPTTTQQLSLMDLKEFSNLNPVVKDAYRKYIADKIFGAMMTVLSTNLTNNQIDVFLRDNDTLVASFVQKIIDNINNTPPFPNVTQEQLKAAFSADPFAPVSVPPAVIAQPTVPSTVPSTVPTTVPTTQQTPTVVITTTP